VAVGSGGEVERLRKLIEPRLLEVDLPELLIEVDAWTNFTGQLTPLSGNRSRSHEMPCVLYAAIVAQATNLGPTGMAARASTATSSSNGHGSSTAASRPSPPASAWLVNYHHQLPLTQAWGSGQLSSSDGQRFASRTRGPGTAALPRYFGHRRRGEPQAEEVERCRTPSRDPQRRDRTRARREVRVAEAQRHRARGTVLGRAPARAAAVPAR
jgi:hypothetical protein